uniref:Uncharacterized protein n=1 Tax=Glossina palpalis gambiensis TaxID=67801 RepID=A0A1B0AW85_9MUSC
MLSRLGLNGYPPSAFFTFSCFSETLAIGETLSYSLFSQTFCGLFEVSISHTGLSAISYNMKCVDIPNSSGKFLSRNFMFHDSNHDRERKSLVEIKSFLNTMLLILFAQATKPSIMAEESLFKLCSGFQKHPKFELHIGLLSKDANAAMLNDHRKIKPQTPKSAYLFYGLFSKFTEEINYNNKGL